MQSKAKTVAEYLNSLPEDRRAALQAVREVILKNLDKDYEEGMGYGMMGYYVPHRVYPAGYHCDPRQPLPFAGLASQKNHMAVFLMSVYGAMGGEESFRKEWAKTGKKLDMGKCCIRFKKLEDVALDVIGKTIREMPAKKFIQHYEKFILSRNKQATSRAKKGAAAAGVRKAATRKAVKKATESVKRAGRR